VIKDMQVDIQLAPGSHSTEAAGAILLNALHCNKASQIVHFMKI
jgi:hypothetical protein